MHKAYEDYEKALRLSYFTIEQVPDAVLWIDSEAYIRHINNAACQLFGYSRTELLGQKVYTFHLNENEQIWRKRWERIKENKQLIFERLQPTKGGQQITVEVKAHFIEFEGEEYLCTFLRDISEWKRATEDLHESQRALSTLINNLPGAVYRCKHDDTLTVEFITEWSQKITGYPPEEVIGNHKIAAVDIIHPDDRNTVLTLIRDALNERKPRRLIYRIVTSGGEIKWVSDRFRAVYSEQGDVLAIEGFFTDISNQVEVEEALKHALSEVERLKDRLEEENIYLRQEIKLTYNFEQIISQSDLFNKVLRSVEQVAATDATVLILGETGTGKELIARAVHSLSHRRDRPLVKVNCAALPANLIESELFGHEKGAFTGALSKKIGRFELADGGTIFLDEIGELPLDLQVKLLRVLQEGEFERLGNPQTIRVNARIITATNRELEEAVTEGNFREDLFYRLNVFPILLPPLRERTDDIPLLVKHFVQKYSKKVGKHIDIVPQKAMDILQEYYWPGNVRELENVIERTVILSHGSRLELGDWFTQKDPPSELVELATLEAIERTHIIKILEFTHWRVSGKKGAAKILNLHPQTLVSRMRKLGIQRPTHTT